LLGFFPGSTIGNLSDDEAAAFLSRARNTLGKNGKFLVGIDLIKETETLVAAYDDRADVTAAFNKNVLVHVNHVLGANFDTGAFEHRAIWNPEHHRIEMHLVSKQNQSVKAGERCFEFQTGETIHTENCHKYSVDGFAALAAQAGWSLEKSWQSANPEFAVLLLV